MRTSVDFEIIIYNRIYIQWISEKNSLFPSTLKDFLHFMTFAFTYALFECY